MREVTFADLRCNKKNRGDLKAHLMRGLHLTYEDFKKEHPEATILNIEWEQFGKMMTYKMTIGYE